MNSMRFYVNSMHVLVNISVFYVNSMRFMWIICVLCELCVFYYLQAAEWSDKTADLTTLNHSFDKTQQHLCKLSEIMSKAI